MAACSVCHTSRGSSRRCTSAAMRSTEQHAPSISMLDLCANMVMSAAPASSRFAGPYPFPSIHFKALQHLMWLDRAGGCVDRGCPQWGQDKAISELARSATALSFHNSPLEVESSPTPAAPQCSAIIFGCEGEHPEGLPQAGCHHGYPCYVGCGCMASEFTSVWRSTKCKLSKSMSRFAPRHQYLAGRAMNIL